MNVLRNYVLKYFWWSWFYRYMTYSNSWYNRINVEIHFDLTYATCRQNDFQWTIHVLKSPTLLTLKLSLLVANFVLYYLYFSVTWIFRDCNKGGSHAFTKQFLSNLNKCYYTLESYAIFVLFILRDIFLMSY